MAEKEFNVSNPHPKFGHDSNIANEFGHTNYPKCVYPNGKPSVNQGQTKVEGVVVNSKEEEDAAMSEAAEEQPSKDKKPAGWGDKK